MTHDVFDELAAVFVLDALDGDDLRRFRAHLASGCDRCETALRESRESLVTLAFEGPPVEPPRAVREALLARMAPAPAVVPSRPAPRRPWLPWALGMAGAAAAAAFFTGMVVASRYEAQLGRMARESSALRARIEREQAALRVELAAAARVVDLMRDPATRVVPLYGAPPAPSAAGRLVWNEQGGGQLFVSALPPTPPDKAYELWTISRGNPRPAGLFRVDASGRAVHPVEPVPDAVPVEIFAVTLEPSGGVPAPTGPIMMASAVEPGR